MILIRNDGVTPGGGHPPLRDGSRRESGFIERLTSVKGQERQFDSRSTISGAPPTADVSPH
jgi:hypothetical protein